MKGLLTGIALLLFALIGCDTNTVQEESAEFADGQRIIISKTELQDKIKGGWAGQVIGCTYGGPTEFQWNGTMIGDHVPIPWDDTRMLWYYENAPGLYDDVYMDLTFVYVFEKHGLKALDSLHALAFAHAEYPLWHANQAARYNILNGVMPPASGHWKNNPHADDIDFQIEADFAGLMSPGMINSAAETANRIGHIMNYGDGVYGGIYVASMYSLAFVYNDMEFIVEEALKTINKVYDIGFRHAAEMIKRNGGSEEDDDFMVKYQLPKTVPLEVGFEGLFPTERTRVGERLSNQNPEISLEIEGCGFVVGGRAAKDGNLPETVLEVDVFADGELLETAKLPTQWLVRRDEITWKYDLPEGKHTITLKTRNIPDGYRVETGDLLVYSTNDPGTRVYFE